MPDRNSEQQFCGSGKNNKVYMRCIVIIPGLKVNAKLTMSLSRDKTRIKL